MNVSNEVKAKVLLFVDGNFSNLRDNIKRPDLEIDENVEIDSLNDLLTASKDERYIPMRKEYTMIVIALIAQQKDSGSSRNYLKSSSY